MSVFKPTGRRSYRIELRDHHGKVKTVGSGYMDRRLAEQLERDILEDVERLRAGLEPRHRERTGKHLGLGNAPSAITWAEAVTEYLANLARHGSRPEETHYKEVKRKLERVQRECGWATLIAVKSGDFTRFLGRLAEQGRAPRTQNSYQETLRALLNWCVSPQEWLSKNPIVGLKMVRVGQTGRRRLRRAYTLEEWRVLVRVAPEPRRTVYLVASFSGFRRSELMRMQKQDCTPAGPRPRWHVRAEVTKNGRSADLPMLPDCAEALRPTWEKLKRPADTLFVDRQGRCAVPHIVTLHADLDAAEVARQDARGRWADFHSFRYFFCTQMGERYPIQKVKELMRHSTIKLTADLYTDLGMADVAETGWALAPLFGGLPTVFPTGTSESEKDSRQESA
jgi:integrase